MTTPIVVLICLVGLAVYVVLHVLVFRFMVPKKRWATIRNLYLLVSTFVLFAIYSQLEWTSSMTSLSGTWFNMATCLLVLFLLHIGYLTFYGFIDRSITLRTFVEIYKTESGQLTYPELVKRYDTGQAYLRRLQILCDAGYLSRNPENAYYLTSKGTTVGMLVRWLKSFYKIGPGG